jgi:hypothetical protein
MVLNKRYSFSLFSKVLGLLILLAISGCNNNKLQQPLVFSSVNEFYQILNNLEGELTPQQYESLTDAIAKLKANDKKQLMLEDFYQSISGLSIEQIIQQSEQY